LGVDRGNLHLNNVKLLGSSFCFRVTNGGAIRNAGTLVVTHSEISGSIAGSSSAGAGVGGALSNTGSAIIESTTFQGNRADGNGGAVYNGGSGVLTAILVLGTPFFFTARERLGELAIAHRLPTMFQGRPYVEAGGLMSYFPNHDDLWRSAADVDRILKGAKPADLPVEQPRGCPSRC